MNGNIYFFFLYKTIKYLFTIKKKYMFYLIIMIFILIVYLSEMFLKRKIIKFIKILPKISLKKKTFPISFFSKLNKNII